ncbi:hypothetical protein FMM75_13280 [Lachnospiraceae bacterium MD335]|jgi:threonine/homoserine/homoserine lactone efflux protein|nr:hypothetical protein [Lachnospiraceae bacterium MD335]
MSFDMILNILIMACGIYMLYWAIQMKRNKKIPEMLVGKNFPIERAQNPEGFIKATFPITFATGALLLVSGAVGALELLASYPMADTAINLLEVVAIIGYGALLMRAQRKYLVGETQTGERK